MKRKITAMAALLLLSAVAAFTQNIVTRNDTVKVFHGSKQLRLPWVGGLNAAHISEIDYNKDGKMDLFVFEPNSNYHDVLGNKILPFINIGTTNVSDYRFAPQYRGKFPILEQWAFLRDYNCDGKPDIFTHTLFQGVKVYRNDSNTDLEFTLITEGLTTDTSGLPPFFVTNNDLFWNTEDMPAFVDVDSDGDMDILTVDRSGGYIEYHKNVSKEKYGTCDSLAFKVKNTCWGTFYEDFGTITLNMCNPYGNVPDPESKGKIYSPIPKGQKGAKHSNTALLAIDLNGDGDKDIIAGDFANNSLYSYINDGKKDSSHIGSYTTSYPATNPVNLKYYPIPFNLDLDNDNKKDLVVSVRSDYMQDVQSIWKYKNTGTATVPNFTLETKEFLQGDMIDVGTRSRPVFFDYNGDSLLDIVIGNLGYFDSLGIWGGVYKSRLALYKNTGGLQTPEFELVTTDYLNLSAVNLDVANNKPAPGLHPTFGDLDNDGDQDMLIGDYYGRIHYFRNDPISGVANFQLIQTNVADIDVGFDAAPHLFDIDLDGKLDLFIGEGIGNIIYYKNVSTANLDFQYVDSTFGNIDVNDFWKNSYSVPFLYRDSMNAVKMLVGTKEGYIYLYDSIINNNIISSQFKLVEKKYQHLWDGFNSSIHGADLNHDNSLDFILGNHSGGISLYTSEDSIYIPGFEEWTSGRGTWKLYPNPTSGQITLEIYGYGNDDFQIDIYDMMGKEVLSTTGKAKTTLETDRLSPGVYVIRAKNKNRSVSITERFVKSR